MEPEGEPRTPPSPRLTHRPSKPSLDLLPDIFRSCEPQRSNRLPGVLHTTARAESRGSVEENQPALLRDGACGVVAATAMNRHCDTVMRTVGPRYRASGNRTQRLQGGEVLNDQDVAPKTMGIIVVVSPLWFNDSRTIAAAQIWPSQLLAWVRTKVLTISNASFWYSGDSDLKYLRI